jgi:hypothetical protein
MSTTDIESLVGHVKYITDFVGKKRHLLQELSKTHRNEMIAVNEGQTKIIVEVNCNAGDYIFVLNPGDAFYVASPNDLGNVFNFVLRKVRDSDSYYSPEEDTGEIRWGVYGKTEYMNAENKEEISSIEYVD